MAILFKKTFFLLILCGFFHSLPAQHTYLFTHLGTREGLTSPDVTGVQQDQNGFIWIATLNGLQRYDGYRFLTFRQRAGDPASIPGNQVTNLLLDAKGRLWMLCNDKVGFFDPVRFTFKTVPVQASKEAQLKAERRLFKDLEGNLYLRLRGEPLMQYSEATGVFDTSNVPFILPKNWKVNNLHQDRLTRNFWITCDSGLVKYNPVAKTVSYRNHNTDNDAVIAHFSKIFNAGVAYMDSQGMFWLSDWPPSGFTLQSFDLQTRKSTRWQDTLGKLLQHRYFELDEILELQDGMVCFTGYSLFAVFDAERKRFSLVPNKLPGDYSIQYDIVNKLYEDREHNIWVGTNNGLYRFNPSAQQFRNIALRRWQKDSIYMPDVSHIGQTASGDLLVSTWGSGVFAYGSALEAKHLPLIDASVARGNLFTWCTWQFANGNVWCGHQGGVIYQLDAANKKVKKIQPAVFESSTIRQMVADAGGNLWLGTQNGSLVKWDAATQNFTLQQRGLSTVHRLYADSAGNIWVCTRTNGVYVINAADGRITRHFSALSENEATQLSSAGASDVLQFNDSLYVIASGGLALFNIHTNQLRYLEINNDAFSNLVTNMVKDKNGTLWVTTQNGLFSINIHTGNAISYNESDGLQNNNFNIGTGQVLRDGRIAFGTAHHFIVFDPAAVLNQTTQTPHVTITGIGMLNKWLPVDSIMQEHVIRLPYDQNSVTIRFSPLVYQNKYTVMYMLENLDKNWKTAKDHEAVYSYLPPGNYTFKVQALAAGNGMSSEVTTLSIVVQAPFWKTWWFVAVLLLVGGAVAYWLDRERMRRKDAVQTTRSSISGNLHEEIHNALQNINVLSEIARKKAAEQPKQAQNYIDEIHYKSSSLMETMDDMLWSIDPANDTMLATVERMKEIAQMIGIQYKTKITVQYDEKVLHLKPDMKRRHELMLIYKSALYLLAKQMQAGTIQVQLVCLKSSVQLTLLGLQLKLENNQAVQDSIGQMKQKAEELESLLNIKAGEKGVAISLLVKQ